METIWRIDEEKRQSNGFFGPLQSYMIGSMDALLRMLLTEYRIPPCKQPFHQTTIIESSNRHKQFQNVATTAIPNRRFYRDFCNMKVQAFGIYGTNKGLDKSHFSPPMETTDSCRTIVEEHRGMGTIYHRHGIANPWDTFSTSTTPEIEVVSITAWFLASMSASLHVDTTGLAPLEQERDGFIMEWIMQSKIFTDKEVIQLNFCRLFRIAVTLSDLTTTNKKVKMLGSWAGNPH